MKKPVQSWPIGQKIILVPHQSEEWFIEYGDIRHSMRMLELIDEFIFVNENEQDVLEMWGKAKRLLPNGIQILAQKFVNACVQKRAFDSEPICHVEVLDEGQVIFDWNSGELPFFTVLISETEGFVFSGISASDSKKGQTQHLKELIDVLLDFVTIGQGICLNRALQGLSSKRVGENQVVSRPYTTPPQVSDFLSTQQVEQINNTCVLQAAT